MMSTNADGEEIIEIYADAGNGPTSKTGRAFDRAGYWPPALLEFSPAKTGWCWATIVLNLFMWTWEKKERKVLDKSNFGSIHRVDWSPDGEWVVYSLRTSLLPR